jgi:hypothetical protein
MNPFRRATLLVVVAFCVINISCTQADPVTGGKALNVEVTSRAIYEGSPENGAGVSVTTFYTQKTGDELLELRVLQRKSDLSESARERRSLDNGRTWQDEKVIALQEAQPTGHLRRYLFPGYVDPATGRLVSLRMEGVLPTDSPLEGMKCWLLYYTVSEDGGRTNLVDKQVVQDGAEYSAIHPLPGVWNGKNAIQIGATTCVPLTLKDGTILVPCQSSPVGPDGEYFNPGGGLTYTDALVLRGRWKGDKSIAWEASQRVVGDPQRSTRGMIEPTLAQLADGRVMMVMRGSNDGRPQLPGYKWVAFSSDEGRTWSTPAPWTYDDGTNFFSPSACSLLYRHPNGKLLWFGNIVPRNPKGNTPRHPLVVGEVDETTGLLRRASVTSIVERGEDDSDAVKYSNFYVRQDRASGEIVLHLSPLNAGRHTHPQDMTANAMVYRLKLGE